MTESMEVPITERSNPITKNIDIATAEEIVLLLKKCDAEIFDGWQDYKGLFHPTVISTIERIAEVTSSILQDKKTGCIVLSGCGTSGRLAFLVARTYNQKLGINLFKYVVAGGDKALFTSQEAPEDDPDSGIQMLKKACIGKKRVLFIGITCGLSAPFVAGQLQHCMQNIDVFTPVLLGFNPVRLARNVNIEGWNKTFLEVALEMEQLEKQRKSYILNPVIGPEPITGSSRMKSGTTTKLLLESIFTSAINKTKHNKDISIKDYLEAYRTVVNDVYFNSQKISSIVKLAGSSLNASGSIYYLGWDSLGIMGMIDASECPPTYGATLDDIRGFIGGGYSTLQNAEGVLTDLGRHFRISISDFEKDILPHLKPVDLLIFLTKGGAVPVCDAVWKTPCKKCMVTFSDNITKGSSSIQSELDEILEISISKSQIVAHLGESVFSEWHQLYRELAVKLVLNSITTGGHIIKGKVYENIMVDLKVSNNKLFHRAVSIVQKFSGVSVEDARNYLLRSIHSKDDLSETDLTTSVTENIQIATAKEKVVPSALVSAITKSEIIEVENLLHKQPVIRTVLVNALKSDHQ